MQAHIDENNKSYNKPDNIVIGSDRWLFKETKGNTLFDKFILNSIKLTYRGSRFLIGVALGKTKRDKLWNKRKITFHGFLYKYIERLRLDNTILLVFDVPKYNFKFCSRITRKINNFLIHDVVNGMNFHEEQILKYFTPTEGDVVIDVGPAFGLYTILASKKVGPLGKVIAIEPQPEILKLLKSNINVNKLDNVTTLNYAAYSKETKLKLYSNYTIISERAKKVKGDYIEVNCNTLDNLIFQLEKIKQVNWIKIDVEGAELEVLKGAHIILSNNKDIALLIEIHKNSEGKNLYKEIIELLHSYNFKIEIERLDKSGEIHVIVRKQQG